MSSVDASKPPTVTLAVGPNSTPLGLMMNTWPLALSTPSSALGSVPVTRFSATEERNGWLKVTDSFGAIPNFCQLMMTLSVV